MRSRWNIESAVWQKGDAESTAGLILAAGLQIFAIFIMPVIAGKFWGDRLTMPDILLFSSMPGIIGYRFFCAEKLPMKMLKGGEIGKIAVWAAGLMLASGIVTWLWKQLLAQFNITVAQKQFALELIIQADITGRTQLFFAICVFTPLIEELLFRRIVYGALCRFGMPAAFLGTAMLFSLCHFFIAGLPGLLVLGLGFQFAYLKFRNLTAAVLLHALVNAGAFAAAVWGSGN